MTQTPSPIGLPHRPRPIVYCCCSGFFKNIGPILKAMRTFSISYPIGNDKAPNYRPYISPMAVSC